MCRSRTHLCACPDQHVIGQPTEEDTWHFMQVVEFPYFLVVQYLEIPESLLDLAPCNRSAT